MRYAARYQEEDGVWLAHVQACGGRGFTTSGATREEAREMARDAVTEILLSEFEQGQPWTPEPTSLPDSHEWVYAYPQAMMACEVKKIRLSEKLSLREAAARMKVSLGTYTRWEDPYKSNATLRTLDRVASAYGRGLRADFA